MRTNIPACLTALLLGCHFAGAQTNAPIPWNQIGARAGADYKGDGLAVSATATGARLHCVFQRLEGEATREGLWLTSTVPGQPDDRFRVSAVAVGRSSTLRLSRNQEDSGTRCRLGSDASMQLSTCNLQPATSSRALLPSAGEVSVDSQTVRFNRPGLVEEYSVSMDGVRQDFVVLEKPLPPDGEFTGGADKDLTGGNGGNREGASVFSVGSCSTADRFFHGGLSRPSTLNSTALRVELVVTRAKVEETAGGAQLVLAQSGRKIAYSRLHVSDATGKELPARMEALRNAESGLVVVVDDSEAVYPVRIDPTFSDANWTSMGGINGANNQVNAAVVDGSGNLYIGGSFTIVGDVIANCIAKWDGSTWSALGSGMNGTVSALAVSGSNVYAGGYFTTATNSGGVAVPVNYIAKWNGSAWSALGSGMGGSYPYVYALAVSGADLFAGGVFSIAGGTTATGIARWNGSAWSVLGLGLGGASPCSASALAVSGTNLYVGGFFTTAGGNAARFIAKWNGSAWSALGSGMGGTTEPKVYALAVSGTNLYAGGNFTTAGGNPANYIAKWNGSAWSPLGAGVSDWVEALAVSGGDLYVGGWFAYATNTGTGALAVNAIAKWNGSTWSTQGSLMNSYGGQVFALTVSGSDVYAGGSFSAPSSSVANRIAKWNGNSWSAVGSGTDSLVAALAVSGTDLYAGGSFTHLGDVAANRIAKWNGITWSALGSGMNSTVLALGVSGTDLYAGGGFTYAGSVAANYIARWNGSSWSPLGSGMNSYVEALAVSGSNVYAAGMFTNAGGSTANYVARWTGSAWSALGPGMNSRVSALVVSGNEVYAGGYFTTAGGSAANYIAKWNGSAWSALGQGLGYDVYALAVSGTDLYAGGQFGTAGGSAAYRIAKWNGSAWSPLGSGLSAPVLALAVSGADLYAGGWFTYATNSGPSAVGVSRVAKWDGSAWSALGSGMNSDVLALAVSGSDLYAGGWFTIAGGKVSAYAAKAIAIPGNWLRIARGVPGPNTNTLSFVGVPGQSYTIQFTTNLDTPVWQPLITTNADTQGRGTVLDPDASGARRFYRVTSP